MAIVGRQATGNLVQGNYIGVDASGTLDRGNFGSGVTIADSSGHAIRGNVISANGDSGVFLTGATTSDNVVEDNYIGTDFSGTRDLGNTLMGVKVDQAAGTVVSSITSMLKSS